MFLRWSCACVNCINLLECTVDGCDESGTEAMNTIPFDGLMIFKKTGKYYPPFCQLE